MALAQADIARRYRERHPDRIAAYNKKYAPRRLEITRRWRAANPVAFKESSRRTKRKRTEQDRLYQNKRAAVAQAFIDAAHADGCVDCGNKNLSVLQSDHVRGTKVQDVSKLVHGSLARLFAELDKCETRCANCHQIKTTRDRRAAVAA